ncbi:dienelactone hydrolase family protein [Emcibacter sp. SYSU 3D8]|uniref:dienelactone hydrolase family protein n=1 Tax=Emcibacter sp. SYSU 3D8 TaxID=3133969 RepID=UPI0031FF0DBE
MAWGTFFNIHIAAIPAKAGIQTWPIDGWKWSCRIALALLLVILLTACGASAPPDRQTIALDSRTLGFIDELAHPSDALPQRITGSLMMPSGTPAGVKVPAMVILHGGTGQGSQDWFYARLLNEWGIAALAVDSFSGRKVKETIFDQAAVSEASIIADAYTALGILSKDPRIDSQRIGIMGFSKGAGPALLASLERFRGTLATEDSRFALHVAFYPWCGFSFLEETATGAPVLILSGGLDRVTPAALCADFAGRLKHDNPGLSIDMQVYPAGGHAFDYPHPYFRLVEKLPVRGNLPVRCFFTETEPNVFVEHASNLTVTAASVRYAFGLCSGPDPAAQAIYDPDGTRDALARFEALVRTTLLGPPPQPATVGAAR